MNWSYVYPKIYFTNWPLSILYPKLIPLGYNHMPTLHIVLKKVNISNSTVQKYLEYCWQQKKRYSIVSKIKKGGTRTRFSRFTPTRKPFLLYHFHCNKYVWMYVFHFTLLSGSVCTMWYYVGQIWLKFCLRRKSMPPSPVVHLRRQRGHNKSH